MRFVIKPAGCPGPLDLTITDDGDVWANVEPGMPGTYTIDIEGSAGADPGDGRPVHADPAGEPGAAVSSEPVTWLRQQVEARRALAAEACPNTDGHWWRREWEVYADGGREPVGALYAGEPVLDSDGEVSGGDYIVVYDEGAPSQAQFGHIALNDPRDTIARCDAELAVLDEYTGALARRAAEAADYAEWIAGTAPEDTPRFPGPHPATIPGLERAVRHLATAYRHHPGYQEQWGP